MAQENLEIVRRTLDLLRQSFNSGEASDGLLGLCATDVRVDASRRVFNPDVYDGHDGVRRMVREIFDAWEDFREDNQSVVEAGDRVLVTHTIRGRGRMSQALVEQEAALLVTVRDSLVSRVEIFLRPHEALEALAQEH